MAFSFLLVCILICSVYKHAWFLEHWFTKKAGDRWRPARLDLLHQTACTVTCLSIR
uniref:Uncharacterized protein n=1 Tax=Arundo donax TaxID=35708 RepID=A0A0A8Y904_ARUDO